MGFVVKSPPTIGPPMLDRTQTRDQSSNTARNVGRSLAILGVVALVLGVGSSVTPAAADPGQDIPEYAPLKVSAAMRAHGPWGATYISGSVVDAGSGPVWAFCTQAPVSGKVSGSTEADLGSMADANSENVRTNAHRIHAVLAQNNLPDPRNVLRLQPNIGIFDWQGNLVDVADVTDEYPLVHQYAQGPEQGHSYYDSLPMPSALRIELAAVQAAVWHYSDGFDPGSGSYFSDQGLYTKWRLPWEAKDVTTAQVLARYNELIAMADTAPVAVEPTITIGTSTNGNTAVFEISTEGTDQVNVNSSAGSLHPYDELSGTCDTETSLDTIDTTNGPVALCTAITSDGEIIVTATGVSSADELVYVDRGNAQDIITHAPRNTPLSAEQPLDVTYTAPTTTTTTTTSTSTTTTTTSTTTSTVPTSQPTTTVPVDDTSTNATNPEQPAATVQRAVVTRSTNSSGTTGTQLAFTGTSATSTVLAIAALALLVGLSLLAASRDRSRSGTTT